MLSNVHGHTLDCLSSHLNVAVIPFCARQTPVKRTLGAKCSRQATLSIAHQLPLQHCCRRLQPLSAAGDNKQASQERQEKFKALKARLQGLSYQELLQLSEDRDSEDAQAAYSASFLFWLSAQENRASGSAKQELSNLAAQLVYIKEQADYEASRRMLPPLASSLAYSNYSNWQADHQGQQLPDVALGVSIADLYKAAEREEAKLSDWQKQQRPASSIDSFAAASGYQQAAAEAMARVRARLMGFADDETYQPAMQQQPQDGSLPASHSSIPAAMGGSSSDSSSGSGRDVASPAAEQILQELLQGSSCREERATVLPEAFMPPGLEIMTTNGPIRLVTTPHCLLQAIKCQQQQQQRGVEAVALADQLAIRYREASLPSGELLQQVLSELAEDIQEYDKHVYSRMSVRDIHGRF